MMRQAISSTALPIPTVRSGVPRPPSRMAPALTALLLVVACAPPPKDDISAPPLPPPPPPPSVSGVNLDSPIVPPDVPAGPSATQTQLARFAWQEFVALNWPSSYSAATPTRGEPSTDSTLTFVNVTTQTTQPLVWQTYKHRVEVFPQDTTHYNMSFNTPPAYDYSGVKMAGSVPGGDVYPCSPTGADPSGIPLSHLNSAHGNPDFFNNLDETTEINLCTMFVDGDPNAPPPRAPYMSDARQQRRFIYQAKANDKMFGYIASNNLYDYMTRWTVGQNTFKAVTQDNLGGLGTCPTNPPGGPIICFPPGVANGSEGMIEVKATWRQLTQEEYDSGRFLVGPIIRYYNYDPANTEAFCYETVDGGPTAATLPYGLVGLHIIHKTQSFPTFVFATFEQVDNLDRTKPNNELFYFNRNSGIVNPNKQSVISRAHPMEDAVETLNSQVHQDIRAQNPNSVWQYYKLIGVQGAANDFGQDIDFFLANIVTETNEALRSFSGGLNSANGTIDPTKTNIYKADMTYIGGGCKGCHGNAQAGVAPPEQAPAAIKAKGDGSFDFSFITANAPFDGIPDAVNQALLKDSPDWYTGAPISSAPSSSAPSGSGQQ